MSSHHHGVCILGYIDGRSGGQSPAPAILGHHWNWDDLIGVVLRTMNLQVGEQITGEGVFGEAVYGEDVLGYDGRQRDFDDIIGADSPRGGTVLNRSGFLVQQDLGPFDDGTVNWGDRPYDGFEAPPDWGFHGVEEGAAVAAIDAAQSQANG